MRKILVAMTLFIASCSSLSVLSLKDWSTKSDDLSLEYIRDWAQLYPSEGSYFDLREFDSRAPGIVDDMEARQEPLLEKWHERLVLMISREDDPNLLVDINILLDQIVKSKQGNYLGKKYAVVHVPGVSHGVYHSLSGLITPQQSPKRKKAAVDRFLAQVNGFGRYKPYVEAWKSRINYQLKKYSGRDKFMPYRPALETYLRDSSKYVSGVKSLLEKSGRNDWQQAFLKFEKQVKDYNEFVKEEILPMARTTFQRPKELYGLALLNRGNDLEPDEMMNLARADYKKLMIQFKALAKKVAKKNGFKITQPYRVVKELQKKNVNSDSELLELYKKANQHLSKIIEDNDLIELPKEPPLIRLGTEAESAAMPIPQVKGLSVRDSSGSVPEFIVPRGQNGVPIYGDFNILPAALVLTAHEARPGHELQIRKLLQNKVTIARGDLAANSTNMEGWALYAEDMVYPYLPLEGQFMAIQSRLWRVARAFLDPETALGKTSKKEVIRLYTKELGLSRELALQEWERYSFRMPGQAPSYYAGYRKIVELKKKAKSAHLSAFNEKCFNEALLSVGTLPIHLVSDLVIAKSSCESAGI